MDTTFYAESRRHKPRRREPLASPASHRRLPKRLLHPFKEKSPHVLETLLASRRSSSSPSDSSDNSIDGEVVCSDTAFSRIDGDHQAVTGPAILRFMRRLAQKVKLDSNDGHKTHGSSQKRHAGNLDRGRREEKKQKQGQGSRNTGGGGGKKIGGGSGGKQPPDGHRYPVPPPESGPQKKKPFACPFHKLDPVRYDCCSSVRLKRPCDVSQHIRRCHLLREVKQKTANAEHVDNAEPADNVELVGNAEAEEEVTLYCPKCRMEFFGITAEANLRQHLPCQTPQPATIEETGVLLPAEFDQLNDARNNVSGDNDKWYAMWKVCFPNRPEPESPYFALPGQEAVVETLVPRWQAREVIRQALHDCLSHFSFTEGDFDAFVNQVLNGIYPGASGVEPQTSRDTLLEFQQRQMPQRQIIQQQIPQQLLYAAVPSTVSDPSAFLAAPRVYPQSHQLYQNPSAPPPFAPTPRVVPQIVPPPALHTNGQAQNAYYGAPFVDATAFALPPHHSPQMSPAAADIETGPPVPFRSAPGPIAAETSPASQAINNPSIYDLNDDYFDDTGFPTPNPSGADMSSLPCLEGNVFPTNNDLNDSGFQWWSNNGCQDHNQGYGL